MEVPYYRLRQREISKKQKKSESVIVASKEGKTTIDRKKRAYAGQPGKKK